MAGKTGRAVVLGGGFAGLVTAGVLAEFFERVTVVERDPMPAPGESRRGVPQGRHTHNLLPGGARALEQIFPGILSEMVAAGAVDARMLVKYRFYLGGAALPEVPIGAPTVQATRPFLEQQLRRRLLSLGVELRFGTDVAGVEADEERTRVTGVRVVTAAGAEPGTDADAGAPGAEPETIPAELVVDAMGRGSRTPVWLGELGYPQPAEERLDAEVAYASRPVTFSAEDAAKVGHLVGGTFHRIPRGILLLAVESGGFLLTLNGTGEPNRPPSDDEGFREFLASAAPPDVIAAVAAAESLGPVATFRFPVSIRRRYESLDRVPEGLLAIGDAICVLNPLNAQGLAVAALQAAALQRCLRGGRRDLARRFHRAAATVVAGPWQQIADGRAALAGTQDRAARRRAAWMARLVPVAMRDTVVGAQFGRVLAMIAPPTSLLHPRIVWRVWRSGRRARRASASASA